jgi:GT2 family glycosyltransferase
MDDDTIPRSDSLAELLACWTRQSTPPALVASRVVWSDGVEHPMNTPRRRVGSMRGVGPGPLGSDVPIRSASFVSVLLEADAVRAVGLPRADYFIWNDDFDFTTRILKNRVGLACRSSTVEHLTRTFGATDADPGARFYYEVRNKLWLFTRSDGLRMAERALYGGATLRRWLRTVVRSRDRLTLLRAGWGGIRDSVRGPRSTSDVLADLGAAAADVRVIEAGAGRA